MKWKKVEVGGREKIKRANWRAWMHLQTLNDYKKEENWTRNSCGSKRCRKNILENVIRKINLIN